MEAHLRKGKVVGGGPGEYLSPKPRQLCGDVTCSAGNKEGGVFTLKQCVWDVSTAPNNKNKLTLQESQKGKNTSTSPKPGNVNAATRERHAPLTKSY